MTNEEAIARIKGHKAIHKMDEPRAIYISEALDMALDALKQQPCDDVISRQAAIDEIKKHYRAHDNDLLEVIAFNIGRLPSVQSERKKGKWIPVDSYSAFGGDKVTWSVLIKGMKKPDHCLRCPFMVSQDNDDCILLTEEENLTFESFEQMKEHCPLAEVPSPDQTVTEFVEDTLPVCGKGGRRLSDEGN